MPTLADETFIRSVIDKHPVAVAVRALQAVDITGQGSPVGKVQAPIGATYRNTTGGTGSAQWAKTGPLNTDWAVVA
jgi:hypothetical protein